MEKKIELMCSFFLLKCGANGAQKAWSLAQTYCNYELLLIFFSAKSSTVSLLIPFRDVDRKADPMWRHARFGCWPDLVCSF